MLGFKTRVQENTRLHKLARLPTNTSTQPHTNRVGALVSSHPGDEVTPVGPGRTSTVHRCLVRQEGRGWPTTKPLRTRHCERKTPPLTSMVAEPQYDHSNNHNTSDTTGNDPRTVSTCPVRRSADGMHVGKVDLNVGTADQTVRLSDALTVAETVTNHKQYDTECRAPTQLTVSRPCRSPSSNPGGD